MRLGMGVQCVRLALTAALVLATAWSTPAQEIVQGSSGRLRWEAPPGLVPVAERLTAEAEAVLTEAHHWLGLQRGQGAIPEPVGGVIYWVRDREELAARLGRERVPKWYAAVARPGQQEIFMAVQVAGGEARLRSTLRHELVHHAMGALGPAAFKRIPSWFHEGLAEVFGGEIYLGDLGISLAWRANNGALKSLRTFADGFPDSPSLAAEGYAMGHAFVQRLIRIYGQPIIGEVLERIRLGDNLDQALIATTRLSLADHEAQLVEELRSFRSLIASSAGQFGAGLFLVAALLLPLALRRRARRRKAMEARWAEQDQALEERERRIADHAAAFEAMLEREERERGEADRRGEA